MKFLGLILLSLAGLVSGAHAAHSQILQRNYQTETRQLIICTFDASVLDYDFAGRHLSKIVWPEYQSRDLTILELSRFRSTSHIPTALGPISNDLALNSVERERMARELGCTFGQNSILLYGRDGTEKARWSGGVSEETLFAVIDSQPASPFAIEAEESAG